MTSYLPTIFFFVTISQLILIKPKMKKEIEKKSNIKKKAKKKKRVNCTFPPLIIASISILPFIYKTEQCPPLCIENMQIVPII